MADNRDTFIIEDQGKGLISSILVGKLKQITPKEVIFGRAYEHYVRGKIVNLTASGTLSIDLNIGSHFIVNATTNSTVTFNNMIESDETCVITMTVTGSILTLPSWLIKDSYSDTPDPTKTREYNILIKQGGLSPNGRYTIINV